MKKTEKTVNVHKFFLIIIILYLAIIRLNSTNKYKCKITKSNVKTKGKIIPFLKTYKEKEMISFRYINHYEEK